MRDLFLSCLAALVVWSLFKFAVERTLVAYALRKMDPLPRPIATDAESLCDEDAFRDGWRACESCRRLSPSIDDDHIMHHYSYDGSTREREKCHEQA